MANVLNLKGIDRLEMGDVGADGTMGTNLDVYGVIKQGTCNVNMATPTVTKIFSEESDSAIDSISEPAEEDITCELLNVKLSDLPKYMGGTYTAGTVGVREKWEKPKKAPEIYQSIKLTSSESGGGENDLEWTRVKVDAGIIGNPTKTDVIGLNVTFTILAATDDTGELTTPLTIQGAEGTV